MQLRRHGSARRPHRRLEGCLRGRGGRRQLDDVRRRWRRDGPFGPARTSSRSR
jgi:hypothetical protein